MTATLSRRRLHATSRVQDTASTAAAATAMGADKPPVGFFWRSCSSPGDAGGGGGEGGGGREGGVGDEGVGSEGVGGEGGGDEGGGGGGGRGEGGRGERGCAQWPGAGLAEPRARGAD